MNVLFQCRIIVHVKIEYIVLGFFVIIFMEVLNKKNTSQSMSFLKDQKKNEMITLCEKCKDSLRGLFFYLATKSELYFDEAKKCLIQYEPCQQI